MLWLLSSQQCLLQVAFRPVLPSELIHQEAFQALIKEAESKSSVRGGEQGHGAACCLHKGLATNTTRLETRRPGVGSPPPGALGRLYWSALCVMLFQELKTCSWQSSSVFSLGQWTPLCTLLGGGACTYRGVGGAANLSKYRLDRECEQRWAAQGPEHCPPTAAPGAVRIPDHLPSARVSILSTRCGSPRRRERHLGHEAPGKRPQL